MKSDLVPEALHSAIAADLQPVRPLPPAWMRTLTAVAAAVFGLVVVVAFFRFQIRPDMDQLPMWVGWGSTVVQFGIGILLIGMAMREAVPGQGVPTGALLLALGTALLAQILVAVVTWMHSPGMPLTDGIFVTSGMTCAGHDTTMALPALAVTLLLVFRALPLRPSIAGLLGGAGAAVTADAVNHIMCPMSDLRHVLVWHTGALLGLMLIGWLVGTAWERYRYRRS